MELQEISEGGIRVLTRPLEATFTFTLLTQCPVKKWHFDKSESKSLRKQSWPNLMFLKLWKLISFEDNCSWSQQFHKTPNQIPVRQIGWYTCIFMKSCWKPLVSLMSGLKIRDAIPQQKCIFFNILLGLVSKHENEDRNSRSRLEAWDRREEILDLVSKHETEGKKFSISSRSMRLTGRNSRSRLEAWDWKEEILDLVSRVEKWISLCSGYHCIPNTISAHICEDLTTEYFWTLNMTSYKGWLLELTKFEWNYA